MVRGINRTVIEINDTGSNLFEKVVFFVTPEYGNINTRQLKAEADRIINEYYPELKEQRSIRAIYRKKRLIKTACFALGLTAILALALFFILK